MTQEPFGSPTTIHHLFTLFPRLREFDVYGGEGSPSLVPRLRSLPKPHPQLALKTLRIQAILSPQKRKLLDAIRHTASVRSLRILELEIISLDDIQDIGRLLSSVGRNLESLTLRIVHRWNLPIGEYRLRPSLLTFR